MIGGSKESVGAAHVVIGSGSPSSPSKHHAGRSSSVPTERPSLTPSTAMSSNATSAALAKLSSSTSSLNTSPKHLIKVAPTSKLGNTSTKKNADVNATLQQIKVLEKESSDKVKNEEYTEKG
ncbi:unnamed protein product, partial [Meganyctiphanes norvegica]